MYFRLQRDKQRRSYQALRKTAPTLILSFAAVSRSTADGRKSSVPDQLLRLPGHRIRRHLSHDTGVGNIFPSPPNHARLTPHPKKAQRRPGNIRTYVLSRNT